MAGFLDLPREVRNTIYGLLMVSRTSAVFIAGETNKSGQPLAGRIKGRITRFGAAEYLDISLIRVCRLVSAEAIECLYSANYFCPASTMSQFVTWLRSLSEQNRGLIRRLEFLQRLFMPLLFDNTYAWEDLKAIIKGQYGQQPMGLTNISAHVPMDFQLYKPSAALALRKLLTNSEQFWWPNLRFFVTLLMQARTSMQAPNTVLTVRLILPTYENKGLPEIQVPAMKELTGPDAFDLEELEAIHRLRVPRVDAEDAEDETLVLAKMLQSGTRSTYTRSAWREFDAQAGRAYRKSWDFVVRWQAGKVGEVLVLV